MILDYDKYSLKIDNKPYVIRSAAFHYFRNPGINVWKDRLSKLKSCGYNTIDIYFCWSFHSLEQGSYNFTGTRDIRQLLDIIAELGLCVIARPGPFINAEISAGGFPPWLFNIPDIILRNRENGNYIYSKSYMKAVKEWYARIIPIINEYSNVIAFQIENEYSSNQAEPDYIQELYDLTRELGIKAPIFHNDAFCACLYSDITDFYAFDVYPATNFDYDWHKNPHSFGHLDNAEESFKECSNNSPLYIAELQSGWFDKWGGKGHEFIREQLGKEHINIVTKTALSQGITMFNHYMGCGGTSWDQLACSEVYSSYDFAAPISECGVPEENYYKAKETNYFLQAFNFAKTDLIEQENLDLDSLEEENLFLKFRKDKINNCNWIFVRNLNAESKSIKLENNCNINLKPYDMKILPQNLNLLGCKINFSSLSIFAKIDKPDYEIIFLLLDKNSEIRISEYESREILQNIQIQENNNNLTISFSEIPEKDLFSAKFNKNKKTTEFIFIKECTADKTWIIENKAIIGPDYIADNNEKAAFKDNTQVITIDINNPSHRKLNEISTENTFILKNLDFKEINCSPEIDINYDYSNWDLISEDKLFDCISNEIYDKFIWYKGSFKGIMDQITINALHCWAIYLNEKQIYSHDSFHFESGIELTEEITINLDNNYQHKNKNNEITILVENMGFDKGFQNEPNLPRGILSFKSSSAKNIEWRIKGGLTPEIEEWYFMELNSIENKSQNSYLKYLYVEFNVNLSEKEFNPLYLELSDPPFDKAVIYLNGNSIGNYWKSKGPQTKFYLLEGFLKEKNTISIIIWNKNEVQQKKDFNIKKTNANIKIGLYSHFTLINIENILEKRHEGDRFD